MTMVDHLERLAALRDKGAIIDAEYEQARQPVLHVLLWIFVPQEDPAAPVNMPSTGRS